QKGIAGAKYIMSPPLRKSHDLAGLWDGLSDGTLEVVSTDHCPFNSKGEDNQSPDDFTKIPKGVGGVDHRLSLLYSKGVLENKITIYRFVNLISTRPAKIFGLYPQKGAIMKGSDADLVIWDPEKKIKISAETQVQNCDSSVYEGFEVTGGPSKVIAGGRVIFDNGNFDLSRAKGKFVYRKR
ncbi:MAG: amidohydrolase family protein, partial [Acidobacteriota bacterium]